MVTSTGARHVEEVAFAVIDLFEIRIVRDILDALLRGNYPIVARHYRNDTEFQPLCEMHRADRELAQCDLDPVTELSQRCSPIKGVFFDTGNGGSTRLKSANRST
jgi:hypothetical protein